MEMYILLSVFIFFSSDTVAATGKPKLTITKDDIETKTFKYGDKLSFTCLNSYAPNTKIKISAADNIFLVPTTSKYHQSLNGSLFVGSSVMDFNTSSVDVTCFSLTNDKKDAGSDVVTLKRIEEPASFPDTVDLTWTIVGGICLLVSILNICAVTLCKRRRRKKEMIQIDNNRPENTGNIYQEISLPGQNGDRDESQYTSSNAYSYAYALPNTRDVTDVDSTKTTINSKINASYTQVIPKRFRKNQNTSKYVNFGNPQSANEPNYAEIIETQTNEVATNKYANIRGKNEEQNYATIYGGRNYANLN